MSNRPERGLDFIRVSSRLSNPWTLARRENSKSLKRNSPWRQPRAVWVCNPFTGREGRLLNLRLQVFVIARWHRPSRAGTKRIPGDSGKSAREVEAGVKKGHGSTESRGPFAHSGRRGARPERLVGRAAKQPRACTDCPSAGRRKVSSPSHRMTGAESTLVGFFSSPG